MKLASIIFALPLIVFAADKGAPARSAREVADQRDYLGQHLQMIVERNNPNLNHITYKVSKVGNGYRLVAVHDLFSKYTLSVGSTDKKIQDWMSENETQLRQANISQVGVWGTGNYASGSWYSFK